VIKVTETEISPLTQFSSWIWSGSRYSGLLCMALSSTVYLIMELVSDTFSGQYFFSSPMVYPVISSLCSVSWFCVKMIVSFMGRLQNVEIICAFFTWWENLCNGLI